MGTRSIGGRTRGGLFAFMDVTSLPGGEVMNRKNYQSTACLIGDIESSMPASFGSGGEIGSRAQATK